MSRTYARRGSATNIAGCRAIESGEISSRWPLLIEARSEEGRRAIARFHSDAETSVRSSAPNWYRRIFDHRLRTFNLRQLRRWIDDRDYDPVFHVRHRHNANWSWW